MNMPPSDRSERLFIGVDGGQSSTRTVLINERGEIQGGVRTGPCNHIHEPGGLERQYRELHAGYTGVFARLEREAQPVTGVYLGLTGSGHRETVESAYKAEQITIENDGVIAHAGALPGRVGAIIIAGTGSIAYGRSASGETALAGGWGYFLGDEGSAYDIAHKALSVIYRASDGRALPTTLTGLLLAHFNCQTLRELHRKIYSGDLSRDQIAGASQVVGQAAMLGDDTATAILEGAGDELGQLLAAVLHRLAMCDDAVQVAPIGGVFKAQTLVTKPMMARLHQTCPGASLVSPRYPPVVGACLLALDAGGLSITPLVLENIDNTLKTIEDIL